MTFLFVWICRGFLFSLLMDRIVEFFFSAWLCQKITHRDGGSSSFCILLPIQYPSYLYKIQFVAFFFFSHLRLFMKHAVHIFIETEWKCWQFWIKRLCRKLFILWWTATCHPCLAQHSVLQLHVLKDFRVRKDYFAHLFSPCSYYRPEHFFHILSRPRSTISFWCNRS